MRRPARSGARKGWCVSALLRRVRPVWSFRLWRPSARRPVGPLVLPRASAARDLNHEFIPWLRIQNLQRGQWHRLVSDRRNQEQKKEKVRTMMTDDERKIWLAIR